ncbi:MAG: IclR family transcriptional regulator [bacterium]
MRYVQSVSRALRLLDTLAEAGTPMSLQELSNRTELHASTAHRLLRTLLQHRYVSQDPDTKKYDLGIGIVELASGLKLVAKLRAEAESFVDSLAKEVGETVNLVVPHGQKCMVIDRVESVHMLRCSMPVGASMPLHCTAAGKALLAYMPKEEAEEIMRGKLEALTSNTITDGHQLREELRSIRAQGYSVDCGERDPEIRCVAAPIRDGSGSIVASMSVSAPGSRLSPSDLKGMAERVRRTAALISSALGYRPREPQG